MTNRVYFIVGIVVTLLTICMCYLHWNDHEFSAWIVALTGWFNYTCETYFQQHQQQRRQQLEVL